MPGGIAVAHSTQGTESTLRAYLLADAVECRKLMTETLLEDGAESAQYAWAEASKAVDRLASGGEHRIHRWQLPDGHPMRGVGSIHDDLVLDEHDVLRVAE
jgi:hypothetical protein